MAAVRVAGGYVLFDNDFTETSQSPWALTRAFASLRGRIGKAFFRDVVQVSFTDSTLDNIQLAAISGQNGFKEFRNLEKLILMNTNIDDEGLRLLGTMPHIRTLYLGRSKVTDKGKAFLTGWTRLEDLGVSNTQIGDDGMRLVDGLKLSGLGARNTRISPAGFSRISIVHPKIGIWY